MRHRHEGGLRRLLLESLALPPLLVFRLLWVWASDGMPIGFERAAANVSERTVAAEILERLPLVGRTVLADKGFTGRDFETMLQRMGGRLLRLDRKDEPHRYGSLGAVRQWIESVFDTPQRPAVARTSRRRHDARLMARITTRLLAMAAAIGHNQLAGTWDRSLIAIDMGSII